MTVSRISIAIRALQSNTGCVLSECIHGSRLVTASRFEHIGEEPSQSPMLQSCTTSSIPPPKRLPRLPLLSRLRLPPPPPLLNLSQLSISLIRNLGRHTTKTDEELRTLEFLRQSYPCPLSRIRLSQSSYLFYLVLAEMVFLLVLRPYGFGWAGLFGGWGGEDVVGVEVFCLVLG